MSILFPGAFVNVKEKENNMWVHIPWAQVCLSWIYWLTDLFFYIIFCQSKFQFYSYGKLEAISIIQRLLNRYSEAVRFSKILYT